MTSLPKKNGSQPSVLVVAHNRIPAHPKPSHADIVALGVGLRAVYATDAHFSPYEPSVPYRLKTESLRQGEHATMSALVFDLDDAKSKRAKQAASMLWRTETSTKVGQVLSVLPGGFFYWTRGGARLIYRLHQPLVVRSESDAREWQMLYICACLVLREHHLKADMACKDWARLFRLPHATRAGSAQPESLGTHGDPEDIGVWTLTTFPSALKAEAETLLAKKYRKKAPRITTVKARRTSDTHSGYRDEHSVLYFAFQSRGWLGARVEPSKYNVVCPFRDGHSTGVDQDNSTVLFDDNLHGTVFCSHTSCSMRQQPDFFGVFSDDELDRALDAKHKASGRALVQVGPDEYRVLEEVLSALPSSRIYIHNRELVLPAVGHSGSASLRPLSEARTRVELSRRIYFYTVRDEAHQEVAPPVPIVRAIQTHGEWPGLDDIRAVVEVPVLRQDGSLLSVPGYDETTKLLLLPSVNVNDNFADPSLEELCAAKKLLLDIIQDFPFSSEQAKSGFLAHLLTFFVQYAITGPMPLFVYDANAPGVGKTLLAKMAMRMGTGVDVAPQKLASRVEEQRKVITSLTRDGSRAVLFDNVVGSLGSSVLDIVATTRLWKDRLLGANTTYEGTIDFVTAVTVNNVVLRARDTARRVLPIRLETLDEHPEQRAGLRIRNLSGYVRARLDALVWAALCLHRRWVVAGMPDMSLPPWGSFEEWSHFVRNPIVFAGLADPYDPNAAVVAQADEETEQVTALVEGLSEALRLEHKPRITVHDLLRLIDRRRAMGSLPAVLAAFEAVVIQQRGPAAARSTGAVGNLFKKYRTRPVGGRWIDTAGLVSGTMTWTVASSGGSGGGGGSGCGRGQSGSPGGVGGHPHGAPSIPSQKDGATGGTILLRHPQPKLGQTMDWSGGADCRPHHGEEVP